MRKGVGRKPSTQSSALRAFFNDSNFHSRELLSHRILRPIFILASPTVFADFQVQKMSFLLFLLLLKFPESSVGTAQSARSQYFPSKLISEARAAIRQRRKTEEEPLETYRFQLFPKGIPITHSQAPHYRRCSRIYSYNRLCRPFSSRQPHVRQGLIALITRIMPCRTTPEMFSNGLQSVLELLVAARENHFQF